MDTRPLVISRTSLGFDVRRPRPPLGQARTAPPGEGRGAARSWGGEMASLEAGVVAGGVAGAATCVESPAGARALIQGLARRRGVESESRHRHPGVGPIRIYGDPAAGARSTPGHQRAR